MNKYKGVTKNGIKYVYRPKDISGFCHKHMDQLEAYEATLALKEIEEKIKKSFDSVKKPQPNPPIVIWTNLHDN